MTFDKIQGNGDVVAALRDMVDSGRIPHSIMFHEDDGGGAMSIVLAFLQYLYCRNRSDGDSCGSCPVCNRVSKLIHPDIHFVFPTAASSLSSEYLSRWRSLLLDNPLFTENEFAEALGIEKKALMIAVSEAKALMDSLMLAGVEGGYRSVVIYLPEKMNVVAANKLLKLIEEPPAQTLLLFVTHSPESIIQTILSRCQRIRVVPENVASIYKGETYGQYAQLFSRLMETVISGDALACIETGEEIAALPSRENIKAFCKFAAVALRDIFLQQQGQSALGIGTAVDAAAMAPKLRKNFPRLALEALDRANMLVGRNVNAKIIFTEFAVKLININR